MVDHENSEVAERPHAAWERLARGASRRDLLRLGLGAAAGAAGASALAASPAGAAGGDPIDIDDTNTGSGTTVLTGSFFQAPLQDAGGQAFNVQAYGATGNGTTDDTSAIEAAMAAAGTGTVLFPQGTYKVGGLSITNAGQCFRLEAGATLLAKAGIAGAVITVTAAGVGIFGPGTIDGNASAQSATTGLDGVMFGVGGDDGRVEGLVVQNVVWVGIDTEGAQRTRIAFNRVLNCGQAGISCKATSAAISGPTIVANEVFLNGSTQTSGINVQGSSATNVVNYPVVLANSVDTANGIGYQFYYTQFGRLVENRGRAPGQVISLALGSDNVISGNTLQPTGASSGIELGGNYVVCTSNTISQSGTGPGIHADTGTGTHVLIANNKVDGAGFAGISVGNYDHVVISGNVVTQSSTANPTFGVIEVQPAGAGLVVISDNIVDGNGGSSFGIFLNSLVSAPIQVSVHDNALTGLVPRPPTTSISAAIRLAGAGAVTDLVVHDNTVAQGIELYSLASGLTLGANVRFHHNTVVGSGTDTVTAFTLPASGTPYVNPGPYTQIIYLSGGQLTGSGLTQGIVMNQRLLVSAGTALKTPLALTLDPGQSFVVYYSIAPNASRDTKTW